MAGPRLAQSRYVRRLMMPTYAALLKAHDGGIRFRSSLRNAFHHPGRSIPRRTIIANALLHRHDLAGVENVLRIERLLQRAHGVERLGTELGLEVFLLALP